MWSKAQRVSVPQGQVPARWRPASAGSAPTAVSRAGGPGGAAGLLTAEPAAEGPDAAEPTIEAQLADAYARGVAAGRSEAHAAHEAERLRLAETVTEIGGLRRQVLDAADEDLMRLAVGMARSVLHREVQLDPEVLLAMAHVALARLGDRVTAVIHLNPDDLALVSAHARPVEGVSFVPNAELPRGGCRVVAEHGEIDLGIDAQMNELSRGLLGERRETNHARLH
jgi:flagellar assembly protein FliH